MDLVKKYYPEDDGGTNPSKIWNLSMRAKRHEDGSFNIYGIPLILESEYESRVENSMKSNNENNETNFHP